MLLAIPSYWFGYPKLSLAYAIAIVGYWMGDPGVNKGKRQYYWLLINAFFIASCALLALGQFHPVAMALCVAILGFTFSGISIFGARAGTLGYGCLFLITSVILLLEANFSLVDAMLHLMLGGLSYHLCQSIADFLLPHQSEKETLQRVSATLAQKLKMHAAPLCKTMSQEELFIQTAKQRSYILEDLTLLENRLNHKNNEGYLKPRHAELYHRLYVLKQMTRRSRLLTYIPSQNMVKECSGWLHSIHQATLDVGKIIQGKQAERPNFLKLLNENIPTHLQEEAQNAHAFIYHLQWILEQQEQTEIVENKATLADTEKQQAQQFLEKMRLNADWHSMSFRHALRIGLCLGLGYMITNLFELHSYAWTLMTSILVLRPQLSLTTKRFRERLFGTLTGLISFAIILWCEPSQLGYQILFFIATFGFFQFAIKNYGYAVCFITLMIFAGYMVVGTEENLFFLRLTNTLLGIGLPILMMTLIPQPRQFRTFQQLLLQTLTSYQTFIRSILQDKDNQLQSNTLYSAVQKDTQLFNCWQLLLMEPKPNLKKAQKILHLAMHSNQLLRELTVMQQQGCLHHEQQLHACIRQIQALETQLKSNSLFDHTEQVSVLFTKIHRTLT